jgi:hypothetical protein
MALSSPRPDLTHNATPHDDRAHEPAPAPSLQCAQSRHPTPAVAKKEASHPQRDTLVRTTRERVARWSSCVRSRSVG